MNVVHLRTLYLSSHVANFNFLKYDSTVSFSLCDLLCEDNSSLKVMILVVFSIMCKKNTCIKVCATMDSQKKKKVCATIFIHF